MHTVKYTHITYSIHINRLPAPAAAVQPINKYTHTYVYIYK